MQQPGWYLKRLRRMSGAEVAYRLTRGLKVVSAQFTSNEVPPRVDVMADLRFLPPFVALSPDPLVAAADRIVEGRVSFFDPHDAPLRHPPQGKRDPPAHPGARTRRPGA